MAPEDDRENARQDEDPTDLFGAYALYALPEEDMAAVDAYLSAHPEAEREMAMLEDAAAMLPYSVNPATPDPNLRTRLMAQVYQEALTEAEPARPAAAPIRLRPRVERFIWPVAAAILLVFTVGFGGWAAALRHDLNRKDAALAVQQTAAAQSLATSAVQGTAPGAQTRGEVLKLGSAQAAVLTISGLPPLVSGRVYEVWFISGNTPVGAGIFTPNPDGSWSGLVRGDVTTAQAIAISVEPAGGSPAPTGDIVAKGSL